MLQHKNIFSLLMHDSWSCIISDHGSAYCGARYIQDEFGKLEREYIKKPHSLRMADGGKDQSQSPAKGSLGLGAIRQRGEGDTIAPSGR